MSGWNIDLLYHQPDFKAFGRVPSNPPSARIVDIEVLKEKPPTSSATVQDKVAHGRSAMRTQGADAVGNIWVNASSVAWKTGSVTANDIALRAWLRSQTEAAEASRIESCLDQLDVYA